MLCPQKNVFDIDEEKKQFHSVIINWSTSYPSWATSVYGSCWLDKGAAIIDKHGSWNYQQALLYCSLA